MRRWIISVLELAAIYGLITFAVAGQLRGQEVDPTGFTADLNTMRAARGLPAVRHDPGIVGVAGRNNELQVVYGLGHHYLGGLAQCSGIGHPDFRAILNAWSLSPGHAAILFSPALTSVGYHQLGTCHTVACSMGGSAVQAPMAQSQTTAPAAFVLQCYPVRRFGFFHQRCR